MFLELQVFILLNNFNSGMFYRLSYEYLKNRFHFVFVIKQICITIKNLSCFSLAFWIWNQNCIWWSVDIIIRFKLILVHHLIIFRQFFPLTSTLHLLLVLYINLVAFLHLLLSVIFFLSASSHLFLPLTHICFLHLLFFDKSWVWLHINWDYKCCESISSYNTSIIH